MKLWQLLAVLGSENILIDKYFSDVDTVEKGKTDVDKSTILASLAESKLQYYVTSDNYLRLMPKVNYLLDQGISIIETLSVLEAYKKFGGDAITEVIDYGSYNLHK
jgi:hypothetical protein